MGCLTDATDASKRSFAAAACHTLSLAMCRLIKRVYSWGPQKGAVSPRQRNLDSQIQGQTSKNQAPHNSLRRHLWYCYLSISVPSRIVPHSSYHICLLLRTGGGPALALKEILCHSQVVGTSGFHFDKGVSCNHG